MKLSIGLKLLLFASLLLGCDQARTEVIKPTNTNEPVSTATTPTISLELTLELNNTIYQSGDSIQAQLRLKNVSESNLLIKNRFELNFPWVDPGERDIYFRVLDSTGKELEFGDQITMLIVIPTPNPGDYVILKARESLESGISNLNYRYQLSGPGVYTLQAYYLNQSDPGDGRTAWKGEISSNIVEFRIEP